MAEPRLIVFDMDGTLIDSGAFIAENMAATFSEHGLAAPTRLQSNSVIGLTLDIALQRLAECDDATAQMLADTYRRRYRAAAMKAQSNHEPLYAGAADALGRLGAQDSSLLGVATGKSLHGAQRILKQHSLTSYFMTVQTPDHNPSKPHPGMMLRACAEAGIEPSHAVMIGDTSFDMELGVAAGAKTIGVTWGYHPRAALEEAGAQIIIEDFADLDAAIEEVLG